MRVIYKVLWISGITAMLLYGHAAAVSAQSAVVLDGDTEQVLFAQNAEQQLPMASTTKIMTALVAIEGYDLDKTYTVQAQYTQVEGSSMYLKAGETLTLRDTLYGLMLQSGNDAALAVAGECGGLESFVQQMNDTAQRLALSHTHFDNPNGLDSETHYTTAHDLARLAAYAMRNPTFREIVSTLHYHTGTRYMTNHNKLLRLYEDAVGVKTGFTKRSGRCLVSAAERNGRRLIAVTLNAPDDWQDHISMLNTAFAAYEEYTLQTAGELVRQQTVIGSAIPSLPVATEQTISLWLTEGEKKEIQTRILGAHFTYAPVTAGSVYGRIEYWCGTHKLAEDTLRFAQGAAILPERKNRFEQWIENLMPSSAK